MSRNAVPHDYDAATGFRHDGRNRLPAASSRRDRVSTRWSSWPSQK